MPLHDGRILTSFLFLYKYIFPHLIYSTFISSGGNVCQDIYIFVVDFFCVRSLCALFILLRYIIYILSFAPGVSLCRTLAFATVSFIVQFL